MNGSTALFLYFSNLALVIYLLALQPSPLWRLLGFAVVTFISGLLLVTASTGDSVCDYVIGGTIAWDFFTALYLLWFTNALDDFRHEKDVGHPRQWSLPRRMVWTSRLLSNPRGVGWNYQIRNIPPRPQQERWPFIRSSLLRAAMYYLVCDMANSYTFLNPLFSPDNRTSISLSSQGPVMHILNCVAFWAQPYTMIAFGYTIASIAAVATGISDPRDWPAFFGNLSESYTLRRFWSHTWQQRIHRFVGIGRSVARSLGFKQGSKASSITHLFVCFTISALLHTGGDLTVGVNYLGRSFPFFFVQAFAITIEDLFIQFARRTRITFPSFLARLFGFTWVLLWFGFQTPSLILAVDLGFTRTIVFPLSPVRTVLSVLVKKFGIGIGFGSP